MRGKILFLMLIVIGNSSAKNHTKCGIDAETSKDKFQTCVCPIGFIGDPLEGCIKIPKDICKKNPCGPNSECIDDKNDQRVIDLGPYCLCKANTYGVPPNCELRCNRDEKCEPNEFCDRESGKCNAGCRFDHSSCDFNEYCDPDSRECKMGCRENHSNCHDNEICKTNTRTCVEGCRDDHDCQLGRFCELFDGKCIPGCRTDENCAENYYCDFHSSTCLKGCNVDENCKFDEYCDYESRECLKGCRISDENCNSNEFCDNDSRKCTSGCNSDYQCQSDEYCNKDNHICEKLCSEIKCGPNSICTGKNNEIYCSCKEGFIQENGIGCRTRLANETNIEFSPHKNRYSFCSKFCAKGSDCGYTNKRLYCSCKSDRTSNSFINCNPQFTIAAAPPGVFCDCCSANQKPGCEVPIDANLLKTLVG